jgi:putative two-component system response regulator
MNDKIKVLAVDDVEINLAMLEFMLADLDCAFLKAGNGRQALDLLEHNPDTDIILLDLEMPVMDGFETLTRLKRSDRFREIPVIVITAGKKEILRTLALGANDFLPKPADKAELKLRVMNHARSKKLFDIVRDTNQFLESEVDKKTAALQDALKLSREAEYEISLRLGKAAEFRDLETGMHTRRVSELSCLLAGLAGLPEEDCELLRKASPLHDVGKIGIPDRILLKPGRLDAAEFEIIKLHTIIGGNILKDAVRYQILDAGQIVAMQHHEKWDGSGYPNGLRGEEIHIFGRIVMIVDIFDALTSDRPYKKAFSMEKSIGIMREGRGIFSDPQLLDLFLGRHGDFIRIMETLRDIPGEQTSLGELVNVDQMRR